MFGRQTARELAVAATNMIQAHIKECEKTRDITLRDIREVKDDLNEKHKENRSFQNKVLYATICLLAMTLGKILTDTFHFSVNLGTHH